MTAASPVPETSPKSRTDNTLRDATVHGPTIQAVSISGDVHFQQTPFGPPLRVYTSISPRDADRVRRLLAIPDLP